MDYIGDIYRPPSEAHSLLLQITVGCSHNDCTFCVMYKNKRFKLKSLETIEKDLKEVTPYKDRVRKVFLMDGDALIIKQSRLVKILKMINLYLPNLDKITTYANSRSILRKTIEELRELRELKLTMVYHGAESGDDEVLRQIDKNSTRDENIESAKKLKAANIKHSVMILLGVGGKKLSKQHAKNTATMLTQMDPDFVGALTLMLIPETPIYKDIQSGKIVALNQLEILEELKTIVELSNFTNCRFSSNHASNYLPLKTTLPNDKEKVLSIINRIIKTNF